MVIAPKAVSTHAHLSVGGRPCPGRFHPPGCSRCFNPRPPVCRWATWARRHRDDSAAWWFPTYAHLSVGGRLFAGILAFPSSPAVSTHAHLSVGGRRVSAVTSPRCRPGFNPRPPVCRWATLPPDSRNPRHPSVSTHAHLSVGGRPSSPRPHQEVADVSTHAHLSVGGRPRQLRPGSDRFTFQPTPTCLSVGDTQKRRVLALEGLPFQPTPTCLSVGDSPLPAAGVVGDVSTHAHLSVGGRLG